MHRNGSVRAAIAALALAAMFPACALSPYLSEGDFYFISRKGATMPVLVRGALDSGTVIIYCHGGPGSTAQYMHRFSFFRRLEAEYGVVYWDQRCSGVSQGNPDPDSFTLQDFTEDLDLVIETVEARYGPASIFLYGTSWGGTLIPAYLRDSARQAKVKGMIIEDGNHNMPLLLRLSSDIVVDYAARMVEAGDDAEYWEDAMLFFEKNPEPEAWGLEGYRRWEEYINRAEPFEYTPARASDEFAGPDRDLIFSSPMSLAMTSNQGALIPRFNILSLDLSADMAAITLPSLLAWGEFDRISPAAMAADFASRLGTPAPDLFVNIIHDAGHNPCIDQVDLFLPLFQSFVEAYK